MASAINVDLTDAEGFQQALDLYHGGRQLGMGSMIELVVLKAKQLPRFPGQQVKNLTGQVSSRPTTNHKSNRLDFRLCDAWWFTLSFAV